MTETNSKTRVIDELADLVEGTARESLLDLVADDDELRDLRHAAQQAAHAAAQAADDYEPAGELEAEVLARLDARAAVTAQGSSTQASPAPQGTAPAGEAEGGAPRPLGEGDRGSKSEVLSEGGAPRSKPARRLLRLLQGGLASPRGAIAAATALVAAVALVLAIPRGPQPTTTEIATEAWHGELVSISKAGGQGQVLACRAPKSSCKPLKAGATITAGSVVETDGTTRAHVKLADGSELSLDRGTVLQLDGSGPRAARLLKGGIVADVAHREDQLATLDLAAGRVRVLGTKFSLRQDGTAAAVDVSRGTVELIDDEERSVRVRAGEQGRIESGRPPFSEASQALAEVMAWSDSLTQELDASELGRGLGELRAKKPGDEHERTGAVTLSSHRVKVRIVGAVARTEVEEVFTNHSNDVLEGIFRFPLPADAKIERLALEVDGKLEEGAFVDRERAAAIWRGSIVNATPKAKRQVRDEIIWVPGPWKDPALLEWQRGNRFELRIFPIPKQGSRRIVLAYTQVIKPSAGVRRYTYPLAHAPDESTRVGEFSVDLEVRGHDPQFGLYSVGYATESRQPSPTVHGLGLNERNFVPSGDLIVEYALQSRDRELVAWAYDPADARQDDAYPYVAMALRPKLPARAADEQRAYAFVVDVSRSMLGENLERAARVTARVLGELPEGALVTVLACHGECRAHDTELQRPSSEYAARIESWLLQQTAEGASDLTAAVESGIRALTASGDRSGRVIYVGDGTPTVGPVRPSTISAAIREAARSKDVSVTALAIGGDADLDSLRAVARGGGGTVLPYLPGSTVAEAAFATLAATYGVALTDVELELPAGLTSVAPERLHNLAAGDEALVVARMTRARVEGTVRVRGTVGGEPFEQRYPIQIAAARGGANAFVPRLYAATRIADLEQRGDEDSKREAIALSRRFDVASRYTSLLVLESPAMFKAFGLDNSREFPEWTGDEETEPSESIPEAVATAATHRSSAKRYSRTSGAPGHDAAYGCDPGDPLCGAGQSAKESATQNEGGNGIGASARPATPAPKASSSCRCSPGDLQCSMRCASSGQGARVRVPPQRWVPMRRTWVRSGELDLSLTVPKKANVAAISAAERTYEERPESREALRELYTLYALSSDLRRASELAEHWSAKDPLDPGALTARADLAAREGRRAEAIRLLGSVVDVRPSDVGAQQRLARLYRWEGNPERGCRYSIALAEFRPDDAKALSEAVRCTRGTGHRSLADLLLQNAAEAARQSATRTLDEAPPEDKLSGDFRLEARWNTDVDLDLSLLHPDGHRVSWLGAPTHSVITATDVLSRGREGLALRGAKAGDYVVEVARADGSSPVQGTLVVTIGDTRREVPFVLEGERAVVGVAHVRINERLVPAEPSPTRRWRP